ncbi:hypothetical protein INT43_001096 [Umbelopsis isabellina]|uniref:Dynein axonemal assembly factor 5 TPR repeats domain-containing protein n=1 Tax=Mortierella isabellina TaxID=91625 RepID=A0A8H7UDG7_MORIS|nr:hypothetical protein INT43_001096 [Umbelopsis isabellina]
MSVDITDALNILQPSLSILQDAKSVDRSAKRRAIQTVRDESLKRLDTPEAIHTFLKNTLNLFVGCIAHDNVEKCREQCLELLYELLQKVIDTSFAVNDTISLCKERVCVNGNMRTPAEESEEIRHGIMRLLNLVLTKCSSNTIKATTADDIVSIVQNGIKDRYPEVQRESCSILLTLAAMKSTYIGYGADKISEVVIPILRHKHAALRTLGVKVSKHIVLVNSAALKPLVRSPNEDEKSIMELLTFDHSAAVREALSDCIHQWLILSSPIERYTLAGDLLPVLMALAVDEIETVRKNGLKSLDEVDLVCLKDMEEAGILQEYKSSLQTSDKNLGLSYIIHHTFISGLKSISHTLCLPFHQNRGTSLKALKMYVEYASQSDVIPQLRTILVMLSTVKSVEKDSKLIEGIIAAISSKIPDATFYLDILLPFANNPAIQEKGLSSSTALWLLSMLFQFSSPNAVSLNTLNRVLDFLKCAPTTRKLVDQVLNVTDACAVLCHSITKYAERVDEVLSDALRYKVITIGTQFLAINSINTESHKDGISLNNFSFSSPNLFPEQMVFSTFRALQHPAQEISAIYAHYLPTILEGLRLSRSEPPEQWNDNSVNMRMVEIMLDHINSQALEEVGVPEQLVEILVRAGSMASKSGNSRETDSSCIRTRIRSVQCCIKLYSLDLDAYLFQRYFAYIFNGLLMPCFAISEPHTGASTLAVQDRLRQQTTVCLKAAISIGASVLTEEEMTLSQKTLVENLHHSDERTRELTIAALITLMEHYHSFGQNIDAEVEKECLSALLERFHDEKKSVRMCLYNSISPLLPLLSDQGKNSTTSALVNQVELSNMQGDKQALMAIRQLLKVAYDETGNAVLEIIAEKQALSKTPELYSSFIEHLQHND